MGAHITVEHNKAVVKGIERLYGGFVIATDIRASCALVLAGLVAQGKTMITGIHHWQRGYHALEHKLRQLGADIEIIDEQSLLAQDEPWEQERLVL
jgi:UDP-N-acetylglucosamine 1-carboxyvinyltransferase